MGSRGIKQVLHRLNADWNFIGDFLNDSESALAGFNLSAAEKQALLARDPEALMAMGFGQKTVVAALSGAHSKTCPTTPDY
jgi:hypothetical protein